MAVSPCLSGHVEVRGQKREAECPVATAPSFGSILISNTWPQVALGETGDLGNVVSGHIAFIPVFGLLKK